MSADGILQRNQGLRFPRVSKDKAAQRQSPKPTERTHRSADHSSPAEYDEEVNIFRRCRS